jgi:hypothetical protein
MRRDWSIILRSLLTLVIFNSFVIHSIAIGDSPPKRDQTEVVHFPTLGDIKVEGVVRTHRLPEVVFVNPKSGQTLLQASLGTGFIGTEFIDPGDSQSDPYPIVRLKVLRVSGSETPIVFAGVLVGGGTDCSYGGRLFAESGDGIAPISPELPMVNTEGGYAIGELEKGRGLELAAWNMIWRMGKEAHVDPHDHWVRIYRFNSVAGKFEFARKYVVRKSQGDISFPNLLRQVPDFGC